jgi:hypothetical protein
MAQLLSQLENRKIVLYKFTRKTQTPSPNKNPHNPTQARHLPVFQALSEAYGPRGIRVAAIKNLAQLYCNNLNRYASLVFRERYIFSIKYSKPRVSIIGAAGPETHKRRKISFGSGIPAVVPAFALGVFTAFARQSTQ